MKDSRYTGLSSELKCRNKETEVRRIKSSRHGRSSLHIVRICNANNAGETANLAARRFKTRNGRRWWLLP